MYIQHRYLELNKEFPSATGLETIDLPRSGLLSGIELRTIGYTAADTAKPDTFMHDHITRIEVVANGSQVIKSLTGDQLLAMMHYRGIPHSQWEVLHLPSDYIREQFYISFGRWYHDLDYMIDLSKVNDPELRLTYDFDMTAHHGWVNGKGLDYGTHKPTYCVIPHLLRDSSITPAGYIKTNEIYRFMSANSKVEKMHVPKGPVYSNLYPQAYYSGRGLEHCCNELTLNVNSDDNIPMDLRQIHIMESLLRMYGEYLGHLAIDALDGQGFPLPVENGWCVSKVQGINAFNVQHAYVGDNSFMPSIVNTTTGAAHPTHQEIAMTYGGCLPFSVGAIPTFDPKDPRTWIDTSRLGDLWVRATCSPTAGTNTVVKLLADEVVTKYL